MRCIFWVLNFSGGYPGGLRAVEQARDEELLGGRLLLLEREDLAFLEKTMPKFTIEDLFQTWRGIGR